MIALLLIAVEYLNDFLSTYPAGSYPRLPQTHPHSRKTEGHRTTETVGFGVQNWYLPGAPVGDDHQTAEGLDLATSSAVRSAASAASEHLEEMAQVYRIAASGGDIGVDGVKIQGEL